MADKAILCTSSPLLSLFLFVALSTPSRFFYHFRILTPFFPFSTRPSLSFSLKKVFQERKWNTRNKEKKKRKINCENREEVELAIMQNKERKCCCPVKVEFHGTDTDTDSDTDILAEFCVSILAWKSACPATSPFRLPRAEHARRSLSDTCAFPRENPHKDVR